MKIPGRLSIIFGVCVVLVPILCWISRSHAAQGDYALAEALADDSRREAAISSILADRDSKLPLLLSWAKTPPGNVASCALYEGLADTFGRGRVTAAISFLIEHISMMRSCGVDLAPWLKTAVTIKSSYPAVGALIEIGPDASRAVMAAVDRGMPNWEDRLTAVFVVSQIEGVPEAERFLQSVATRAQLESHWAGEGLKRFEKDHVK